MNVELSSIMDKITGYKWDVIELQKILTSIPALAPESGGDGEIEKADALAAYLKKLGFPEPERYDAPDKRVSSGVRPNMVYRFPGEDSSKTIYVMAHLDVVPEGDRDKWNSDPFRVKIDGDIIYGRGVEDNHHGLAASVFAAKVMIDLKLKPKYNVGLLYVADEEVGSTYGIRYVLDKHDFFKKDDLIIVPDSGDKQGKMIEIAEKSIVWIKVETTGKQCHASRPDQGINAFHAASKLAARIYELYDIFNEHNELFNPPTSTFEPTKKEINVPNVNTIPGDDVFWIDCRVLPSYKLEDVEAKIRSWADEIEKSEKVTIKISHSQRAQAAPPTSEDAHVVQALKRAIKNVYPVEPQVCGIGGGTVAALFRRAGYPAAVWSTIHEMAHQPNEYTDINNIIGDAQVFARVFLEG